MEVREIKPIGYCFGVIQAINKAMNIRKEYPNRNIYVFGLLVHNDDVTNLLKEKDIETIDISNIDPVERLETFNKDDIVIFTAHSHPQIYEEILMRRGITYFDTTCSNVKKNLKIIDDNIKDNQVIYIGQKNHPETVTALSRGNNVLLYEKGKAFDYNLITYKNPIVINQTTLSLIELKEVHEDILKNIKGAYVHEEICNATRIRQEGIIKISDDVDLIVIVGSNKSSNSRKLYEVAINNHHDKKVIMINSMKELEEYDLCQYKKAVIASGTSSSLEAINKIKKYLEEVKYEGRI